MNRMPPSSITFFASAEAAQKIATANEEGDTNTTYTVEPAIGRPGKFVIVVRGEDGLKLGML